MKEAAYVHEDLHEFEVLKEVDDFYLARHKEYGGIYVVYSYDNGYQYHCVLLDKLFDIDTDKLIEEWMNAIGKMITAQRPYSYKNIFGGDEDEIL